MIIKWKSEYIGTVGLEVSSREGYNIDSAQYHGIPSYRNFWLDSSPKAIHPDRLAIAAFLLFGSYMSGPTQFPKKFSPAVETAMQRALDGVHSTLGPVEYYPKALPIGSRTIDVSWTDLHQSRGTERGGTAYFRVERSDHYSGALRSMQGLVVASNAWIHGQSGSALSQLLPYIAAAVLFAEDLEGDTIRIPQITADASERSTIIDLLGSVRLGFGMYPE